MAKFKVQANVMGKWLDCPFLPSHPTAQEAEGSMSMLRTLWPLCEYRVVWERTAFQRKRAA